LQIQGEKMKSLSSLAIIGLLFEGEDSRGNGLVLWCNGQWLFMTIGDSLSDASSPADVVGY
jgi:hypothetical protein